MHFFGDIKNKITNVYKSNTDNANPDEYSHIVNILKEENSILKEKIRLLENSVLSKHNDRDSSQFGKIFNELKSTIIYNNQPNTVSEFRRFLYDNMLFYGGQEDEDVEILNNIQINEEEWDKNKDLFLYKQKIIQRNYNEMMKNMIVSEELNIYLKRKQDANNSIVDHNKTDSNKAKVSKNKSNDYENKLLCDLKVEENINFSDVLKNSNKQPVVEVEKEKNDTKQTVTTKNIEKKLIENILIENTKPILKETKQSIENKLIETTPTPSIKTETIKLSNKDSATKIPITKLTSKTPIALEFDDEDDFNFGSIVSDKQNTLINNQTNSLSKWDDE